MRLHGVDPRDDPLTTRSALSDPSDALFGSPACAYAGCPRCAKGEAVVLDEIRNDAGLGCASCGHVSCPNWRGADILAGTIPPS